MNDANNHHPIQTRKEMTAMVAAYRQSGLSLKGFARERGIRPSRLHYWVYHKVQDAQPRSLAKKPRADRRVGFREVKLEAGSALLQSWAAEVSLVQGLSVRFSGAANPEWIGSVVQALQRPC